MHVAVEKPLAKPQAAEFCGIHTRTLDRYVQAGEIAAIKLGTRVLFLPADLRAFLASHRVIGPGSVAADPQA